jgi:nucleotide-binding universal stress UspA family protein
MNEFKTIILTTDFSETSRKAAAPAAAIAKTYGAKILLVHVTSSVPPALWEYPGLDVRALEERQLESDRAQLLRFASVNLPGAKDVEPVALLGDAHVEIVKLAKDCGVDLIVMATHGRGFMAHAMMGSTTERVLRTSPCPVLAVRDHDAKAA